MAQSLVWLSSLLLYFQPDTNAGIVKHAATVRIKRELKMKIIKIKLVIRQSKISNNIKMSSPRFN